MKGTNDLYPSFTLYLATTPCNSHYVSTSLTGLEAIGSDELGEYGERSAMEYDADWSVR